MENSLSYHDIILPLSRLCVTQTTLETETLQDLQAPSLTSHNCYLDVLYIYILHYCIIYMDN